MHRTSALSRRWPVETITFPLPKGIATRCHRDRRWSRNTSSSSRRQAGPNEAARCSITRKDPAHCRNSYLGPGTSRCAGAQLWL